MSEVTLNGTLESISPEEVDLADLAAPASTGGALPKGWYGSSIVGGYQTKKGHQFATEDTPSKDGTSRNLRICFKIGERFLQTSFNYRATDFTAERVAHVKALRKEFEGVQNWPDKDAQRSSLAIAKLGQFQKALGFTTLKKTPTGVIIAAQFVEQSVDIRLNVNEDGYNDVKEFAKFQEKSLKSATKAA